MGEVLKAANSSFDRIVKSTVFVKDMNDFAAVNEIYGKVRKPLSFIFRLLFNVLYQQVPCALKN